MGWSQALIFLTFAVYYVRSQKDANFLEEFCNPLTANNERLPRNGIFQPPNMDCPTYAIICESGLPSLEYCPTGQVFLNSACMATPRKCGGADEIDCRLYPGRKMVAKGCSREWYWCTDGRLSKHQCNVDRYFNPANDQCDFFENVNLCTGKDTVLTSPKPYVAPEVYPVVCTGKPDGDYADPTNSCTQIFYQCANELTFKQQCSGSLFFDAERMNCQRREETPGCGGKRVTNAPANDFNCVSDGNYAHSKADACSQTYYTCNGGAAKKSFCSDPKQAFNPSTGLCDVKKNVVGCDPGHCEGKKDGRYPTPNSSGCDSTYLECVYERSYIRSCAATLFYNKKSTNCEWRMDIEECGEPQISFDPKLYDRYQPTNAPPSNEQITVQTYNQPSNDDGPNHCVGKADGRHQLSGGSGCDSSYLECTHGRSLIRPCPPGLVFNKMSTNCEWPATVVGCDVYQAPQQPTNAPAFRPLDAKILEPEPFPEADPVAQLQPKYNQVKRDAEPWGNTCKGKSDGFYHVSECSRMFVACFKNKNQMYKCPDDYVYSSKDGRCVYPQTIEQCNTKSPQGVSFTFCNTKPDGTYPYEQCSVVYIVCRESKTVVIDCTSGQVFNSASGQCDDPNHVSECKADEADIPNYPTQSPYNDSPMCPPNTVGLFPLGSCISDHYSCTNGQLLRLICSNGKVFDPILYCVEPSKCSAGNNSPRDNVIVNNPVAVVNTPTCPPNIVGVFSGICVPGYYSCINGLLKQYMCTQDSVFGIGSSSCIPKTDCMDDYHSLYPTQPPPEDNSACPSDVVGLFTKDVCVQEYYSCFNGQILRHACQVGNVFDNSVGHCVEQDLCTVLPNSNDQITPLIVPGTTVELAYSPMSCGPNEYFAECPRICESTCPRRYRQDCYTDERCQPTCLCRPGFSRRLSSNICIPNFMCYGGFDEERDFDYYRPGRRRFFDMFRRGGRRGYMDIFRRGGRRGFGEYRRGFGGERRGGRDFEDDRRGGRRGDSEENSRNDSGESDRDTGINDDDDKFFCAEREDGYYAMPGDLCTDLYYKCRRSKVDFWRCGKGKSFDSVKQRCVTRSRTCWSSITTLPEFFCQGKYEQQNYTFPFPDCSKQYYNCTAGVPVISSCPSGFLFSNKEKHCVKSRRCRRENNRDVDPDHWFCTDKIDHGFSFPKQTCSARYYQCGDDLASFRVCPKEHVFDGFSCVPKEYCISVDDKADTLDNVAYTNADLIRNSDQCTKSPEPSFIITGNDNCDQEFGFCYENKTTIHKCGGHSSFTYALSAPETFVECKTLAECLQKKNNDNAYENTNFPEADDFCTNKQLGFYPEKECGQKYALCYCSNDDIKVCNLKLLRLTCPDRRYVFDNKTSQCVLRRTVKKCNKEFDAKDYCHGRKRSKHELYPCAKSYLDCESYELRYCSKGLLYNERYGCGRYNQCYRRRQTYSVDLYYPGPDMYSEFDNEYSNGMEFSPDYVPPPFSDMARSSLYNQPAYPSLDGPYQQPGSSSYDQLLADPNQPSSYGQNQASTFGSSPFDQLFGQQYQRPSQEGRSGYTASNPVGSSSDTRGSRQYISSVQGSNPRPSQDGSNSRPIQGSSYSRPSLDGTYSRPSQDGSYNRPSLDGTYSRPSQDGSYNRPSLGGTYSRPSQDGSYNRPSLDGTYSRPSQDGSYNRPSLGGTYSRPSQDGSYNRPSIDGTYSRPSQDGSYNRPEQDRSNSGPHQASSHGRSSQDGSYGRPSQDGSYGRPSQDGSYGRPSQDGSYKQPNYQPLVNRPTYQEPLLSYQPPKQPVQPIYPVKPSVVTPLYQTSDAGSTYGTSDSRDFCLTKPDGYYRLPSDCSKFVQCHAKITNIMKCATGLVFNPHQDINGCDYPSQVPECNFVSVGSDLTQSPECNGKENGAFLRVPADCNRFQRCVFGRLYDFNCPATTVFNINLNACDWPDNVPECGGALSTYQ